MIIKEEIEAKVEALLGNGEAVGRALELKEIAAMSIAEGGSSYDNFNEFVESMKKLLKLFEAPFVFVTWSLF
ncbi:hypothetical protein QJS10_CPB21g01041 [Acorus calamus]|uniref:Uncharacterized protein n=1 Tax=Acorus calamus TaxID=4465 RepID=A0AAV9C6H9_ACOCL|nr:hypothetical protein QJS10_CPB21g01041 [Acorus calamus]